MTSPVPAISFVIPARNEAVTIAAVVDDCLAFAADAASPCEVIVVDDASTDGTGAIADDLARRGAPVRVLRHATRQGIAATTHKGLSAARHDVICYLDGDGQFAARDFAAMIAALADADFVVGRRVRRAERGARVWGSRVYNAATRLAGVPVHDVNCGCRVLTRTAFQMVGPLVVARTSFYFAELTLRLVEMGLRVVEVPIAHRHRRGGVASGGGARIAAEQFVDLWRYVVGRARRRVQGVS